MNYRLRKYLGFTLLTLAVYVTLRGGAYAEEAPVWFKVPLCIAARCSDPNGDSPPIELRRPTEEALNDARAACPGEAEFHGATGDFLRCKPTTHNYSRNIRCVDRGGQLEWDALVGTVVCR